MYVFTIYYANTLVGCHFCLDPSSRAVVKAQESQDYQARLGLSVMLDREIDPGGGNLRLQLAPPSPPLSTP